MENEISLENTHLETVVDNDELIALLEADIIANKAMLSSLSSNDADLFFLN